MGRSDFEKFDREANRVWLGTLGAAVIVAQVFITYVVMIPMTTAGVVMLIPTVCILSFIGIYLMKRVLDRYLPSLE